MSSEGDQVQHGEYELHMQDERGMHTAKIRGSVDLVGNDILGWQVQSYDDNGVRVLPRVWPTEEYADAFALGFIDGMDQGMVNAINVLDQLGLIDKTQIELLPQRVRGPHDGDHN